MTRFTDSRALRGAALVAVSLASVAGANAADMPEMPWLRGTVSNDSPGYARWDGLQIGGQIGLSNLSGDFSSASNPQVAYILRNSTLENEFSPSSWSTLPKATSNGRQFGGFIGYNMQWDEFVLGAEIGYNRMQSLEATSADSLERLVNTSDGVQHDVLLQSSSSLRLVDYGTFRARAGYAFGQFLPYAVIGGAIGRFNYVSASTVTDQMSGAVNGTFQQSASDALT